MRRSGRNGAIGSAEKVGVRLREEEGPSLITYRRQRSNMIGTPHLAPGRGLGIHQIKQDHVRHRILLLH